MRQLGGEMLQRDPLMPQMTTLVLPIEEILFDESDWGQLRVGSG